MDLITFRLGIATGANLGSKFGRQREAMDLVSFALGHAWEATGGNGFVNFRAGNLHWDTLGRQREAMDLVTFGLGITTGTCLGGNGRQWI